MLFALQHHHETLARHQRQHISIQGSTCQNGCDMNIEYRPLNIACSFLLYELGVHDRKVGRADCDAPMRL